MKKALMGKFMEAMEARTEGYAKGDENRDQTHDDITISRTRADH